MPRRLILPLLLAATPALADDVDRGETPDDMGDQSIAAELGAASGGRVTPGGLRIAGHYYYQLSATDWFDGTAAFTYGSGDAGCFRDRMDTVICDHGVADGGGLEIAAGVRRFFTAQGQFRPFLRAAAGLAIVRFPDDSVTGLALPLHAGGGVRARIAEGIAVVGEGELSLGIGVFNRGLGLEPQFGLAVTAGAEFRLP